MAEQDLNGIRVAILATDGFEQIELEDPRKALENAGAKTTVIAPKGGTIYGMKHHDKSGTIKDDLELSICHAPWLLVSAGLAKGRTLTSYHTNQDDLRNSGANWTDRELIRDRNWVTSRQPSDIPAFNREMITLFGERKARGPRSFVVPWYP